MCLNIGFIFVIILYCQNWLNDGFDILTQTITCMFYPNVLAIIRLVHINVIT